MYKPKIYFAGKCNNGNHEGRDDWRTRIADASIVEGDGYRDVFIPEPLEYEDFLYCGPFIIDDHCWYGRVLAMSCLAQINECDIVFAWIDSYDCYGTLYELGYAAGIGKPVYIYHNSCLPEYLNYENGGMTDSNDEHWFCKELCTYAGTASSPEAAFWDFLNKRLRVHNPITSELGSRL